MQRVLLYEFASSGGLAGLPNNPSLASIRVEGWAMLSALAADFAALAEVETQAILDADAPQTLPTTCQTIRVASAGEDLLTLSRWSKRCDWTIVIAPEFDELLQSRLERVAAAGGRALASPLATVALAADKHRTAEYLRTHGVPAPQGIAISPGEILPKTFVCPAVLKPRSGAGSRDVRLIASFAEIIAQNPMAQAVRLEEFCPGIVASLAVLCGPKQRLPLLPCAQRLSADGRFQYLGGRCPLPPDLAARAEQLALRAIDALPDPLGYIGVDLVLGDDASGAGDWVIEVNPRMTTSYVGLRAMASVNLAGAMLDIAAGRPTRLSWHDREVEFAATGEVRILSEHTENLRG